MYVWVSIYHDAVVIDKSVAERPKKDQTFKQFDIKWWNHLLLCYLWTQNIRMIKFQYMQELDDYTHLLTLYKVVFYFFGKSWDDMLIASRDFDVRCT